MCACSFFLLRDFYYRLKACSLVKPDKFPQDSGCLACDEFLVIFKGDHTLREGQTITTSSHERHVETMIYFTVICNNHVP